MAVHAYLTTWDQCHLSDKFKNVTLDRFLAIPHEQAMAEYGDLFAEQHQNLCNTLRKVLMQKLLVDRIESIPPTPRKKRPSDLDSLALNIKRLSLGDRPGIKRELFKSSPSATHLTVATREERVCVKDRLGVPVRANKQKGQRGSRLRYAYRTGNPNPNNKESPGAERLNTQGCSSPANPLREDSCRGVYSASRANSFKRTYYNNRRRRTGLYV